MTANSIRLKIARGLLWKTFSNFWVVSLGLVTSIVLNRWYGPDQYGLLVMVFTVTSLATTYSGLGSQPTINRHVPLWLKRGRSDEVAAMVVTGVFLQTLGIILLGSLILLTAKHIALGFFHREELVVLLMVGLIAFTGISAFNFMANLFQALEKWRTEGLMSVLYPTVYLVGIFFALAAGLGIWAVLVANGIGALVAVSFGFWRLPSDFKLSLIKRVRTRLTHEHFHTVAVFGLPILFNQTSFFLLMWFDKAWLGRYSGAEILTYYYLATLFYSGLIMFLKALYTVFMPHVASLSPEDTEEVERQYTTIFRCFLHTSILMSLVAFWWIEPAVKGLYGSSYAPTIWVFRWLLVVFLLRAVLNPCGIFIRNVFGHTAKVAGLSFLLATTNIILDVLLIPSYGITGAIIASIIAYLVYWAAFLVFAPEVRSLLPLKTIQKTALTGLAITLFLFLFRGVEGAMVVLLGILFPVAYILGLKIAGEVKYSDWQQFRKLFVSLLPGAAETVV